MSKPYLSPVGETQLTGEPIGGGLDKSCFHLGSGIPREVEKEGFLATNPLSLPFLPKSILIQYPLQFCNILDSQNCNTLDIFGLPEL